MDVDLPPLDDGFGGGGFMGKFWHVSLKETWIALYCIKVFYEFSSTFAWIGFIFCITLDILKYVSMF
jgi:hypothetical protein